MTIHILVKPVPAHGVPIIHDITQPQHGAGGRGVVFQPLQGGQHFFFQPQRLLVYNKQVRLKGSGRCQDNGFSDVQGMFRINADGQ